MKQGSSIMPVIGKPEDAEKTPPKETKKQLRLKKKLICSDGNWTAKGQTMSITLPKLAWED